MTKLASLLLVLVDGKKLATPVVVPVHSMHVTDRSGTNVIPPCARHQELAGATWTIRAYETGRFTQVPTEYWRVRGAPALAPRPAFASELIGFIVRETK